MAKRVTKGNLWGFIQSRPYVSVADIRRLFLMEVEGAASLASNEGAYYIGLPREAADLIRQLWQEGRIILDLNPDVKARVVQGVYPSRLPSGRPGQRYGAHAGTFGGSAAANGRPPSAFGTRSGGTAAASAAPPAAAGADTLDEPDGGPRRRRRRRRREADNAPAAPGGAADAPLLATAGE